jgi:hypothetical protein
MYAVLRPYAAAFMVVSYTTGGGTIDVSCVMTPPDTHISASLSPASARAVVVVGDSAEGRFCGVTRLAEPTNRTKGNGENRAVNSYES